MTTLITNLRRGSITSKATTHRNNHTFTSMCEFAGEFFGTMADGSIRKLGGNTDDGVPINAYIKTHKENFNVSSDKRLRFVYLAMDTDGDVEVTVGYSETLSRTYTISSIGSMQILKVPIRREEFGEWIDIKVANVDGANLTLREIEVLPMILPIGKNRRGISVTDA